MKTLVAGSKEWLELYRAGAFANRPPIVGEPKNKPRSAAPAPRKLGVLVAHYGEPCAYCERPMLGWRAPTRDHVRPRHMGAGLYKNTLIVCGPCNNDKGGKTLDRFVWWLEKRDDPRAAVVRQHIEKFAPGIVRDNA